MNWIEVKDLSFYYDREPVISHVNLSISQGEFVALTGENGAAKTTLVKLMIGILSPKSGSVFISRKNQRGEAFRLSYIPQHAAGFNAGFPSTVTEFVRSGRYRRGSWFKKLTDADRKLIFESLSAVGMWEKRREKIGTLSGGQKQRILIARMLCARPDLYVLDEPTTGMDEKARAHFYELLKKKVTEEGASVLMITHEYGEVKRFADRNIHLENAFQNEGRCDSDSERQGEVTC